MNQLIIRPLRVVCLKYPILLPLAALISGFALGNYLSNRWIYIALLFVAAIAAAVKKPALALLLFIPVGILMSSNPFSQPENKITNYLDRKVDLEGTVFRLPENMDDRTRLFLDADTVISRGTAHATWGRVIISGSSIGGVNYGDRIRIIGIKLNALETNKNPGTFDVQTFYGRQDIYAIGFLNDTEHMINFGHDKSYCSILSRINSTRLEYGRYMKERFEYPENTVINSVTTGDKSGLPYKLRTDFSRTGVAHVLAISGLHVGAVAVFFFFLIKWLLKRSEYLMLRFTVVKLAAVLTIIPVLLYTAVAGFSSSATRAFIMITAYLLSVALCRSGNKINTLGVAAFTILNIQPGALYQLSFQLSFTAVLAILLVDKAFPFKSDTLRNKLWSLVKTTLAAGIVTFPLVSGAFGVLPLVSLPANLIVVPFVNFLIVPLSLMSFSLFQISEALANPLIQLNVFLVGLLINGVDMTLKIPYSWIAVPGPGTLTWILLAFTLATLAVRNTYPLLRPAFPIAFALFLLWTVYSITWNTGSRAMMATILDVGGNKSSVFITLPEGQNILIDGGYSRWAESGYTEKTTVSDYMASLGVGTLDYLILTSTDRDHLEGAGFIISRFEVENILTNGEKLDSKIWETIHLLKINWQNLNKVNRPITTGSSSLEILPSRAPEAVRDSSMPLPVAIKISVENTSYIVVESGGNSNPLFNFKDICEVGRCIYYVPLMNQGIADSLMRTGPGTLALAANNLRGEATVATDTTFAVFDIGKTGALMIYQDGDRIGYETFDGEKGTLWE